MSRMSELSQVLDEMIAYGEGMIKAANALKDILELCECMGCKEHQRRCTEVQCLPHHSQVGHRNR